MNFSREPEIRDAKIDWHVIPHLHLSYDAKQNHMICACAEKNTKRAIKNPQCKNIRGDYK